jgi:hypothetical protein
MFGIAIARRGAENDRLLPAQNDGLKEPSMRSTVPMAAGILAVLVAAITFVCAGPTWAQAENATPWRFAVSGDSRDCGDVVMPAIAAGVLARKASFYWHLGDFRKSSDFDEDMQHEPEHIAKPMSIAQYETIEWNDFIENQIAPFGALPVFLGIGNHELVPPHTRDMYMEQFADWLDKPVVRDQRLKDGDHMLKTYYHWVQDGIDFITLDNGSFDQFDAAQVKWVEAVLQRDEADPAIRTVVVGMHRALPDSISAGHSMNESAQGTDSGRQVYKDLLAAREEAHKRVYVLASHSHYYMADIFETAYWKQNGGVLPGWIVGTAGAQRYPLPPNWKDAQAAETNVYGFVTGAVQANAEIQFEFHRLEETDIPPAVVRRFTPEFVHWCFAENSSRKGE